MKKKARILLWPLTLVMLIVGWYMLMVLYAKLPMHLWFDADFIKGLSNHIGLNPLKKAAGLAGLTTTALAGFIAFVMFSSTKKKRFGDARFATRVELRKYGYMQSKGIIIGQQGGKLLMSYGPKTTSLVAKPRSGKGVSYVVPNLLNWEGSCVCIDVKKELVELTSGYRAQSQDVFVFDPLDPDDKSHSINVFDTISTDPRRRISDVNRIAHTIIPSIDPFWDAGGRGIFIAVALFLIETNQHVSLGSIYRWVNSEQDLQRKLKAAIQQFKHQLSPECIGRMSEYANKNDVKVASGFLDSFNTKMEPFSNPLIAAATDHSDFSFQDLREKKTTIYLVVRPEDLDQLGKLFGLICDQMIFALTRNRPEHGEMGSILFMLDEFTALGKLDRIKKGAAFLGGYGIRLAPVYQNKYQPETTYSATGASELAALSHERIIFAPADIREAELYSRELGNTTVKVVNKSVSSGRVSRSYSEGARALMSADELMRLPEDEQIILAAGQRPIKCKKIQYYTDERFTVRLLPEFDQVPTLRGMDYHFKEITIDEDGDFDKSIAEVL